MTRLVGAQTSNNKLENYLERVAKYVPVEIVLAYLAIQTFFPTLGPDSPSAGSAASAASHGGSLSGPLIAAEVIFYVLLVIGTPFYLLRYGSGVPHRARQAAIATASFVVWTYGINGHLFWDALQCLRPDAHIMSPSIAGGLVVLWSLAVGIIEPK